MNTLCIINNLAFEKGCPESRSDIAIPERKEQTFAPGQAIFNEESRINGVYCLRVGRVAVMKRYGSIGDLMIYVAEPGDLLGSTGIVIGDRYINSGVALSDVSACFIPREEFLALIRNRPEIMVRAMERLSKRIDRIELEAEERA
jgi:CRP/FNR family transcriptional regulator